jgi:hypothetical protein
MSVDTPPVVVVEIDDLWFRIQKMRSRRSARSVMALTKLLGGGIINLLVLPKFESTDDRTRLIALGELIAGSAMTGGKATDPDVFEAMAAELVQYTPGNGGQGVCYAEEQLEADAPGWVKMVNLSSLDPYAQADYSTHLSLLWQIVKLNFRPTSAGTGTSVDTVSAGGIPKAGRTGPANGTSDTQPRRGTGAVAV